MTKQTDLKKLAEQMASSMTSFDDIKDFQKHGVFQGSCHHQAKSQ